MHSQIVEPSPTPVKHFSDLPIGVTYFTIIMGQVHECRKIDERHGRKVHGRKGKVFPWPNPKVYLTAEAAQADFAALLERGRQIIAHRQLAVATD